MPITAASLKMGVTNALRGFFCTALNATDPLEEPVYGLIRDAANGAGPVGSAGVALADGIKATRRFIRRQACDEPSGPDPDFQPQFTGGQCPVLYRLSNAATTVLGSTGEIEILSTGTEGNIPGPILGFTTRKDPNNSSRVQSIIRFTAPGGGEGIRVCSSRLGSPIPGSPWTITNLRRQDGGADNCGDPPPVLPEADDSIEGELDIDGEDENGDPITLPGEPFILFGPTVNVNGDIVANVNFPDLDLCGQFRIGDGAEFIPQSCGPRNKPPLPKDTEPEGDGTDEPDDEFDDDDPEAQVDENETIVGVFVKSQAKIPNPYQGVAANGSGPDLLIPRIAQVSWKVEWKLESEAVTGWTEPIDIKTVNSYVPAPKDCRVFITSVQWQPNWKGTFQNVVQPYPPPCCGDPPPEPPPPP